MAKSIFNILKTSFVKSVFTGERQVLQRNADSFKYWKNFRRPSDVLQVHKERASFAKYLNVGFEKPKIAQFDHHQLNFKRFSDQRKHEDINIKTVEKHHFDHRQLNFTRFSDQRKHDDKNIKTVEKHQFDLNKNVVCQKNTENSKIVMPWFGLDIGGTLSKLVFFEPKDPISGVSEGETKTLSNITEYLTSNSVFGKSGHRDAHLQMENVNIFDRIGTIHFIRFSTSMMKIFLEIAKDKGFVASNSKVCVTGGGAFKFENDFKNILNMKFCKCDELVSLIRGMFFTVESNNNECYFWTQCHTSQSCSKREYTLQCNKYPFIVVNIGSGVSILAVYSKDNFKRISGTSIGGGTFMGLCSLLIGCDTFNEAIELAANGDHTKVDKLVKDIYGKSYSRFGLPGEVVACSFGHMNSQERRAVVSKEDLAKAILVTVTNNIASIAMMCALNENIERVCFVGNFNNPVSMQLLSHAMNYWSNGSQKALFLNHEGYFGAIGCLLSNEERCKDCSD